MQIITFNTTASIIDRDSDSLAIRIAYLLGETVAMAGNVVHDFAFKEMLARTSLKYKVDFLEQMYNNENSYNPGIDYYNTKRIIKNFAASKNKTTQLIAAYQKLERSVTAIFDSVVKNYSDKLLMSSGFIALVDLIDEKILKVFITGLIDEESTLDKNVKASCILSLDFDEASPTKIFLLKEHFFRQPFADNHIYVDADHPDANLTTTVMIEPLFTMPNPSSLKISELKLIRNELTTARQHFHEKFEEWVNLTCNGTNFEERKTILQSGILAAAKKIKDVMLNHPNFKHLEMVTNNERAIEVCIAEIPFQLILDYHVHYKIIKDGALRQLKVLQQTEEKFNRKWPVIFYRWTDAGNTNLKFADESSATTLVTKKTISVD